MRDLWTGVPTIRLGASEWSKTNEALGIIHSLGGVPQGKGINGWFDSFSGDLVEVVRIVAPVAGQVIGGQQILAAGDNKTQITALTSILTGTPGNRVYGEDRVGALINQMNATYGSLPYEQRKAQMAAICPGLVAQVPDPQSKARIQAACNKLSSRTTWEIIKWPVILGGLTAAGLGLAFVLKPKMFQFGDFQARL